MKKSLMYLYAQLGVLNNDVLDDLEKLEILRELMAQENLAIFIEGQNKKESAE